MIDRMQFIEMQVIPTLGDYADDFDVEGICDEVSDFDPREGYVWKDEYVDNLAAYNEVLKRFEKA